MEGGLPGIDWRLVLGTSLLVWALAQTRRFVHRDAAVIPSRLVGQNRLALWLYALLMLPGTVLHELSHAGAATLMMVEVHAFDLSPSRDEESITLGTVETDRPDILRRTVVGLAPLFIGTVAVLVISALAFDLNQVYAALVAGKWPDALHILTASIAHWWDWLAVYLVFAISASMFPSPDDLPRGPRIAVSLLPILLAGGVDLGASFWPWLVNATNTAFRWLVLIFAFTLVIDLPILLLLTASTEAIEKQFPR